jgi:GNAT superfamily N-acetyltransferase
MKSVDSPVPTELHPDQPGLSTLAPPMWVPVMPLTEADRPAITQHLLQLDNSDRYLRFGYSPSDAQIERYVDGLSFSTDQLMGVYNRHLHLIAMVHLAGPRPDTPPDEAELGISVSAHLRGRGFGRRLFEHAMLLCRNHGITTLRIHALTENRAMLHLAQSAGASVDRMGSEAEAVLRLPASNLASWWEAWLENRAARLDFTVKQWSRHPDGRGSGKEHQSLTDQELE